MQPNDFQGFIQAGGHLFIFLITGGLTLYFATERLWAEFIVSLFIRGTSASFFKGIAAHELGHGTVFKTKALNSLFLRFYSIISWHNHHEYAMSHAYHHRYTLHLEGDREVVLPLEILMGRPFYLLQIFTLSITGGPVTSGIIPIMKGTFQTAFGRKGASVISEEWSNALYTTHAKERPHAIKWARLIILFHTCVLLLALYSGLWALPLVLSTQQSQRTG